MPTSEASSRKLSWRAGSTDSRLLRAFSEVPRHEFIGASPWYFREEGPPIISDDPALLYQDVGIGLVHERGIPTGLPSLHACCMAACQLEIGENVIQIGAGSGYFSAILAELVGESGSVLAFEIDTALAETAAHNLKRWKQVRIEGTSGVSAVFATADVIYVNAGVQQLPRSWLEALAPGGRLLVPLTPGPDKEGGIFLVRRLSSKTALQAKFVCRARFFPCIGTQDAPTAGRLGEAYAAGGQGEVRSLRLYPENPDETAWVRGSDWWLSTQGTTE